MERIGAPSLLTHPNTPSVENLRGARDLRFVLFATARLDSLERRTAIAFLR
jgi:hypothetical protein